MEGTALRPEVVVNMHEACLHFSSECSPRSGIQTDTEIIAVTGLLVNADPILGRDRVRLGIGELKMPGVVATHSV